jgi:hypothetical protein
VHCESPCRETTGRRLQIASRHAARSPRRVRLSQAFRDKRLTSSGRDFGTTPAPLPAARASEHGSYRLSVYEWTPSRRAQIGKGPQINAWPLMMSPSTSGVRPVGRLPDQLLFDHVVFRCWVGAERADS